MQEKPNKYRTFFIILFICIAGLLLLPDPHWVYVKNKTNKHMAIDFAITYSERTGRYSSGSRKVQYVRRIAPQQEYTEIFFGCVQAFHLQVYDAQNNVISGGEYTSGNTFSWLYSQICITTIDFITPSVFSTMQHCYGNPLSIFKWLFIIIVFIAAFVNWVNVKFF